jgi:hypothetical protein
MTKYVHLYNILQLEDARYVFHIYIEAVYICIVYGMNGEKVCV